MNNEQPAADAPGIKCPLCGETMWIGGVSSGAPGMEDSGYFAIECPSRDHFCGVHGEDLEDCLSRLNSRAPQPRAQEPAAEPVAWMIHPPGQTTMKPWAETSDETMRKSKDVGCLITPLYARPQPAQPREEAHSSEAALRAEIERLNKENDALTSKFHPANFPHHQATNCGKCGQYKHTPWRDDEWNYVCATCLVEIKDEQAMALRKALSLALPFLSTNDDISDSEVHGAHPDIQKQRIARNVTLALLQEHQERTKDVSVGEYCEAKAEQRASLEGGK